MYSQIIKVSLWVISTLNKKKNVQISTVMRGYTIDKLSKTTISIY